MLLKQLFLQPQRQRVSKRIEATRRKSQVGFQQPVELQERLVVEGDEVQLARLQTADGQTSPDSLQRKGRIVLDAGKTFFLGSGDDTAVNHQGRGSIVVISREPQDAHQNSV